MIYKPKGRRYYMVKFMDAVENDKSFSSVLLRSLQRVVLFSLSLTSASTTTARS